jgi:uncharacterized protein with LGFP repeats
VRVGRAAVVACLLLTAGVVLGGAPAGAVSCTQADPIGRHYCQLGGPASVLGPPVGVPYAVGPGRAQDYVTGSIYWSAATGAAEVHGAIGGHYRQLGGPLSPLGFPLTDELGAADGVGRFNDFQHGSITFTVATGAHEVRGAIWGRWVALGRETSELGYPLTDELGVADGVGRFNDFQHGSITFAVATGAHEVRGAI